MTLAAGQLLIIEPQSVGKCVQKDEATVASQLTFAASNKSKHSSRGLFRIPQPPARRGCVQGELLGARCPPGQAVPWAGRWPQKSVAAGGRWGRSTDRLSVSQRICWVKHCFSLSARRLASLSDLPKGLQHSLSIQFFAFCLSRLQTCTENSVFNSSEVLISPCLRSLPVQIKPPTHLF